MADPNTDPPPQLYQIIGSVLRDVAQARYMSDRYSRQISFQYEKDSLLRTFPVPRVEIEEVEFDLHFGIIDVTIDPRRHTSENAAISSIFDQYSISITRAGMAPLRAAMMDRITNHPNPDPAKANEEAMAANQLDRTFLSDENRSKLRGRLLRFFNEDSDEWFDNEGNLKEADALKDIGERLSHFRDSLADDKELAEAQKAIPLENDGWKHALDQALKDVNDEVQYMLADIKAVKGKYPDYKIDIEVSPEALRSHPAISHVRVKSAVKNYRWSKVDVDTADMRNVRSLTQE